MTTELGIEQALTEAIYYLEAKIRETLESGNYPSGKDEYREGYIPIEDSAIVEEAKSSGNFLFAKITWGGENAPYATAFEFGSGEHAGGGTYPIKPVQANALAFFWERIGDQVIVPKGGGFKTYRDGANLLIIGKGQVDHPGIEARPYIEPTVQQEINVISDMVERTVSTKIMRELDEAFPERIEINLGL